MRMNFNDDLLSLNSFEQRAMQEEWAEDRQDKTLIFKESRFYQYRDCATCSI